MFNKRIVIFGYSGSIHLKKWALSLKERGCTVRVISLAGDEIDGIEVIRFPRTGKFSYFIHASQASKKALEFQPDIIHVHYAGGYGIWGLKAKFHPLVLSVWGSDVESLPKSIWYRHFIKSALTKADIITATSESLKKSTLAVTDTIERKIKVVPFGVHIQNSYTEINEKNKFSAIYLKHLHPVYAPEILIQATAQVVKKYPQFKLTMCGDGPLKNMLIELTAKLHLKENISFIGYIENEKVPALIQQHGFMVMPSLKEGFGVAAVESFACARPVVATNVGGVQEIVTDSVNGYLVNPNDVDAFADAMIRMMSDLTKMKGMGKNGYTVATEKFDWQKSVDNMIDIYSELL